MRALFGAFLFSVLLALSGGAHAAQVSANSLNCRSRPDASAPVVAKLTRGRHVEVSEAGGGWSHVVSPNCWVVARYLTADSVGYAPSRAHSYANSNRQSYGSPNYLSSTKKHSKKYSATRKSSTSSRSKRSSSRRSSGSGGSYGGSCPCSGSNVCIGPRGGRYCITSGGNKRYGV